MNLESIVGNGERILWKGRPDRKCFLFEQLVNPLSLFTIIWIVLVFTVIDPVDTLFKDGFDMSQLTGLLVHLTPLWLCIFYVVQATLSYIHEFYIVTDRAVYVSRGTLSVNYRTKPFAEISRVNIHRGIFDQMLKVGDVVFGNTNGVDSDYHLRFADIPDFEDVFALVKRLQEDVYADVQYPNALRPDSNPGYQVRYGGELSKGRK